MQKKGFALIIFSILLVSLIAAIGMAWTPPTAPPPQETVPAPLNTGPQPQTKQGPLTVKKLEVAPDSDEFFLINRSGATYPLSFKLGTDSAFVLRAVNLNILTVKEGKIGILADPPTATLDINGTIKIRGGNPGANKVLTSDATGLASWKTLSDVGITNYWILSGSNLYTSSTNWNVGIGMTNAEYKLDVSGTIRAKDVFSAGGKNLIIGDDTYLTDIDEANMLGIYGMQNSDRAGIRLGSDGSYIFGDNGNIGIGTTNPGAKLEINGQIKITGGNPGENKVLTSDSNGLASWKSIETQFPDGTPNIRITTWLGKVGQQDSKYTRYGGSIAEGSPSTSGDYSYALDIKTHRYMTVLFEHRVVRGYRTCTYTLQKLTSSGWQDVVSTSWTGSSSDVKEETTRAEWDLNNIPNNTHLRIKISWTGAADEDDCMCSAMMAIHSNTPNTYFMPWNKFNLVNNVVPN